MDNFNVVIPIILRHEGGFVNNAADPGGATNYGISLRFLSDHSELGDFDGDGDVDVDDIRMMSLDDAINIYRVMWWDKYGYGDINDATIAAKIMDLSVNMGASRAHKIVQASLNQAFGLTLAVDGILGRGSKSSLNQLTSDDDKALLLSTIGSNQSQFYLNLIANKPSLRVFQKGWLARAGELTTPNMVA